MLLSLMSQSCLLACTGDAATQLMKQVRAPQDLERSMEGLNIRTDLHLCYLITPYNEILCRDWQKCYDVIVRLQVSPYRGANPPSNVKLVE